MGDNDEAMHAAPAHVQFGLEENADALTPERRAIERIKRKATGMAIAAAAEPSARRVRGAHEDFAPDGVQTPLARTCRCADANVKAYREGVDWMCHTCGYGLSARASRQLTVRRGREPATTLPMPGMQRACNSP